MLEEMLMFGISALLALGCLGAAGWIALNPETLDVDKIFSILACLMLAVVFLGIAAWMLLQTRLRELWQPERTAAASKPRETSAKKDQALPEEAKKSAS